MMDLGSSKPSFTACGWGVQCLTAPCAGFFVQCQGKYSQDWWGSAWGALACFCGFMTLCPRPREADPHEGGTRGLCVPIESRATYLAELGMFVRPQNTCSPALVWEEEERMSLKCRPLCPQNSWSLCTRRSDQKAIRTGATQDVEEMNQGPLVSRRGAQPSASQWQVEERPVLQPRLCLLHREA